MCQLTPDGIVLDLKLHKRSYAVRIAFAEIEELRALTDDEAEDMNVSLDMRHKRDLFDYLRGKIVRPSVYQAVHRNGRTLLIRGRNLVYLMTVDPEGLDEVFNAYAAYRAAVLPLYYANRL